MRFAGMTEKDGIRAAARRAGWACLGWIPTLIPLQAAYIALGRAAAGVPVVPGACVAGVAMMAALQAILAIYAVWGLAVGYRREQAAKHERQSRIFAQS